MYDKLIYTGKVTWKYRIRPTWESLKIVWAALNGWIVSGLEASENEAWSDGMKAGMAFGRGSRRGYQEVIDKLSTALIAAGKILEDGYEGEDPTHPNFRPAWEAYEVIRKVMEDEYD